MKKTKQKPLKTKKKLTRKPVKAPKREVHSSEKPTPPIRTPRIKAEPIPLGPVCARCGIMHGVSHAVYETTQGTRHLCSSDCDDAYASSRAEVK